MRFETVPAKSHDELTIKTLEVMEKEVKGLSKRQLREVQFSPEEEKKVEAFRSREKTTEIGPEHFKSLKVLGKGSFGDVYLVERILTESEIEEEAKNIGR